MELQLGGENNHPAIWVQDTCTVDVNGRIEGEPLALLPGDTLPVLFETVPSMLIGMALLGAGVFEGDLAPRRQAAWGWTLWLLGMAATVPIAAWAMARGIGYWDSFAAIFGWAMAPNLLSALGLLLLLSLWARRAGGDFARLLAATGQCAFTNYIGTSALALAVFSGLGLGLFGKLGLVVRSLTLAPAMPVQYSRRMKPAPWGE